MQDCHRYGEGATTYRSMLMLKNDADVDVDMSRSDVTACSCNN